MVVYKLTGKDVMRFQKISQADRAVLWASAIISLILIFVSLFS